MIYRAIAGAVKNAADAHPHWPMHDRMRTSIAKRATGTLLAQMREHVGEAQVSSEKMRALPGSGPRIEARKTRVLRAKGEASGNLGRFPVRFLQTRLGFMVWQAKLNGDSARMQTLIEVLRLIAKLRKGETDL